ncbi:DUF305 domain-containing protein [Catellatospora methionotrophica]|uniref:DUF305 domain-containing protein n=1 Tax=Catellatospora methionotrophica TaxID=121620 RepID=UPI0033CEB7EE
MSQIATMLRRATAGRWRWTALALVAGMLVGFSATLVAVSSRTPGDDSAEAGFARDMSAHHAQAVAMGLIAAKNAVDPQVRAIGEDIALTQQGQIGIMSQWLRDWELNINSPKPPMSWMPDGGASLDNGLMPGMASAAEIAQLEQAEGRDVDRLFLKMMVKHHLGGIHMVDGMLDAANNPDVTWLASTMKAGQRSDIAAMEQLQHSLPMQ